MNILNQTPVTGAESGVMTYRELQQKQLNEMQGNGLMGSPVSSLPGSNLTQVGGAPRQNYSDAKSSIAVIGPVIFDYGEDQGRQLGWYEEAYIHGDCLVLAFKADTTHSVHIPPKRLAPKSPITVTLPNLPNSVKVYNPWRETLPHAGSQLIILIINRSGDEAA